MSEQSTTNSRRQTSSTKCRFTPTQLCSILEACGKAGVTSLKWGDLEVSFVAGQQLETATVLPAPQIPDGPMSEQPPMRVRTEEERLSDLMIDDPVAYEMEMIRRDEEHGDRAN